MDIAKYIGLFLIKKEYCYLPGIGTLTVAKQSARYDKQHQSTEAPSYTVVYEQGHGSIDDTLANFIATNERVSISQAANQLREFCGKARDLIKAGETVNIPAIGTFSSNDGTTFRFDLDPHLSIKGKQIPTFEKSNRLQEKEDKEQQELLDLINTEIKQPTAEETVIIKRPKVNWGKILVMGLIVLGFLGGAGYFVNHLLQNQKEQKARITTVNDEENTQAAVSTSEDETDSLANANVSDSSQTLVTPTTSPAGFYQVVINEYNDLARAEGRAKTLATYGNDAKVIETSDAPNFKVVLMIPNSIAQDHAVDSLRTFFNPKGNVRVLP